MTAAKKSKKTATKKSSVRSSAKNNIVPPQDINIVDVLLIDHKYLKECISVLKDEDANKRLKLSKARGFLDALSKHSEAEKKTLYAALENEEDFHAHILEGYVEHGIVDSKVKSLKPQVAKAHGLSDEIAAELKVLAELVEHHVREEESEILPKVKKVIDEEVLMELGAAFMKRRRFTENDLSDFPQLQNELMSWKDSIQLMASRFVTKMDKYVESLKP